MRVDCQVRNAEHEADAILRSVYIIVVFLHRYQAINSDGCTKFWTIA